MEELDFESDRFDDIVAKDDRYDPKAYTLLLDVIHFLSRDESRHVSAEEILEEFRERTLDLYGPLSYTVLLEWGVKAGEDLGEMMFNLVESKRIAKDESDSFDDFSAAYDFKEAFLGPYEI